MATLNLLLSLLLISFYSFSQTGKLIVHVQGIRSKEGGELSSGIFVEKNFPNVGKQLLRNVSAVATSTMQIVFEEVPVGTYGVVSFQDVDKNKKLNSNFVGLPTEPIGFSRDAKIKFGPPDFEDAAITIEPGKTLTITIILR